MTARRAPAPDPRPGRTSDWTKPSAYLRPQRFLLVGARSEEPRRGTPHARFPADSVPPPGRSLSSRHRPFRIRFASLLVPVLSTCLVILLWMTLDTGASSEPTTTGTRTKLISQPPAEAIRAHFGLCSEVSARNCVRDGATFFRDGRAIRIAGVDAPRSDDAACEAERLLGRVAAERLRELLSGGAIRLAASAPEKTDGLPAPHRVEVDGRDVASLLLAEGHVRARAEKARGWCN